jgi:hypothetical protein
LFKGLAIKLYARGLRGDGRGVPLVLARNVASCLRHPVRWWKGYRTWRAFALQLRRLRKCLAAYYDLSLPVPRIIHFVHLYPARDLPLYALIAIRSAMYHHPDWRVVLHCYEPPSGPLAATILDQLILSYIAPFDFFGLAQIVHPAHKADIVRLVALNELGGLYLDLDTVCVKSFDKLRNASFVMGIQASWMSDAPKLCNATMLAASNSEFGKSWQRAYQYFRSRGRDILWDLHSVCIPARLAINRPKTISVCDHDAFFFPMWDDVARMLFDEESEQFRQHFGNAYSFHLWSQFNASLLRRVTPTWLSTSDSVYARLARESMGEAAAKIAPSPVRREILTRTDAA